MHASPIAFSISGKNQIHDVHYRILNFEIIKLASMHALSDIVLVIACNPLPALSTSKCTMFLEDVNKVIEEIRAM